MGDTAGRAAPPPGAARPPAARSGARAARGGVGRSDSPRAGGADELRSPGEAGDGRRRTEVLGRKLASGMETKHACARVCVCVCACRATLTSVSVSPQRPRFGICVGRPSAHGPPRQPRWGFLTDVGSFTVNRATRERAALGTNDARTNASWKEEELGGQVCALCRGKRKGDLLPLSPGGTGLNARLKLRLPVPSPVFSSSVSHMLHWLPG